MHSIPILDIPKILESKQKPRLFQTDQLFLLDKKNRSYGSDLESNQISLKSLFESNSIGVAPIITRYFNPSQMTTLTQYTQYAHPSNFFSTVASFF